MIEKNYNLSKLFLGLWAIGALISFILQFFLSETLSSLSLWNNSFGWQREIALWDIGAFVAISYALKLKNAEIYKFLILFLSLLSLLLGTNHLITIILSGNIQTVNVLGVIFNYLIVIVILGFYIYKKEKSI